MCSLVEWPPSSASVATERQQLGSLLKLPCRGLNMESKCPVSCIDF
jgi:hypothetical protein